MTRMTTNPAINVLQRERDDTDRQISDLTDALKSAKEKRESLVKALSVLTGQTVAASTSRNTSRKRPKLKEGILDLLSSDGAGLVPAEAARLLTENGRETKNTTVSSMLSLMKKEGIVIRRGGKWFLSHGDTSQRPEAGKLPPESGGDAFAATKVTTAQDLAHKVTNDPSQPHQNPAPAGAGKTEAGSDDGISRLAEDNDTK
ncbi:MAG: hypothetical protein GDA49_02165 [Rhodospirillales bacterium]|nr:hypothetical protein [Rhodospirillales bacterium]